MKNTDTIYFEELVDEWLQQKRISVKNSTYVKYRNSIEKHIIPELGKLKLNEIDNRTIIHFTNCKLATTNTSNEPGLSHKTVKDLLLIINNILKYGRTYYPNEMAMIEIVYPPIPKAEIRILSHNEQHALEIMLFKEMDNIKLGILICLYTGLRLGEICALRWEDICLSDGTIFVRRTVQRLQTFSDDGSPRTRLVIDVPKTRNSVRRIPIPDFLLAIVKDYYPENNSSFLLTNETETYMDPRTLENHFYHYTKSIENFNVSSCDFINQPKKLTFHSLRHTFATRCVESGFEIKCLSEILGHSNVNITLNRYVHSSLEMKRINMNKLNNAYQSRTL